MKKSILGKLAPFEISVLQTQYIKGIGILLIIFHNYFHWISPSAGENEFNFVSQRVFSFFELISKNPQDIINLLFSYLGHYGVQIFIFISGYGLTKSYISKKPVWKKFLTHRISKIYPSLLVGIAVLFLFIVISQSSVPGPGWYQQIILKLLMVHTLFPHEALSTNGPWWFYGLIFQLYVLFPIVYKVIKKWNVMGLITILILSYISIFTLIDILEAKYIYIMANAPGHLPEFAFGVFLALRPKLLLNRIWLFIALAVFILGNFYFELFPFTFIAITLLMLLAILAYTKKKDSIKLEKSWIVKYGQLSMFVFAVHGFFRPPFTMLAGQSGNSYMPIWYAFLFFITVTGVAIASEVGYNHISKLILQAKKRFITPYSPVVKSFITKHNLGYTFKVFLRSWAITSLVIISIRLLMLLWLAFYSSANISEYSYLFIGAVRESLAIARLTIWIFIPFVIFGFLFKNAVRIIIHIIYAAYIVLLSAVSYYYLHTQIPLDDIILFYSFPEILKLISEFGGINLWSILFTIIPVSLFFIFNHKLKNLKFSNLLWIVIILSLYVNHKWVNPSNVRFNTDSEFHKAISYSSFLFSEISHSESKKLISKEHGYQGMVKMYQESNPNKNYLNSNYPFFHNKDYKDVLSKKLNINSKEKSNLVFIVIKDLILPDSDQYSNGIEVTPFLDSLSRQSLYWPNCLSVSNQTSSSLPVIFNSFYTLPDSRNNTPNHISLLQYFDSLSYNMSFYYGGDTDFGGLNHYMTSNNVKIPLKNTDISLGCDNSQINNWGWNDETMYQFSYLIGDSDNNPFVNIYLNLSSNPPYNIPNKMEWESKIFWQLASSGEANQERSNNKRYIEKLSSLAYADNSLKGLFNEYKKRESFENTIFIITSENTDQPLSINNTIEKHKVPLIIYSPKIDSPEVFTSLTSHLDIAPSIYGFLASQNDLNNNLASQWLGTELDTSDTFTTKRNLAFLSISNDGDDYLFGEYLLSGDQLYELSEDLELSLVSDTTTISSPKKELENIKNLSLLAIDKDLIVSSTIHNSEKVQLNRTLKTDFEDRPTHLKYGLDRITFKNPISGKVSAKLDADMLYGTVIPNYLLKESYREISINLEFDYVPFNFSHNKFPSVVFQVSDKNNKTVWYDRYDLNPAKIKPDDKGVYHFSVKDNFRLMKPVRDSKLKVYIYNSQNNSFIYDNISYNFVGKP